MNHKGLEEQQKGSGTVDSDGPSQRWTDRGSCCVDREGAETLRGNHTQPSYQHARFHFIYHDHVCAYELKSHDNYLVIPMLIRLIMFLIMVVLEK